MNEDALIHWLRRRSGVRGLGDDAAVLPGEEEWIVTMDSQVEGVHFVSDTSPGLVGRRLLRVNLSDLAAMGACPAYAFLALNAPSSVDPRDIFRGVTKECVRFGVDLAGGDLSSHRLLTLTMTLIGRRSQSGRRLRRDAVRPGDRFWVGGPLGDSSLGCRLVLEGARLQGRGVVLPTEWSQASRSLQQAARRAVRKHLLPDPQLDLGLRLTNYERCAAMDVSDGLSKDLSRLCRESGVGAEIHLDQIPLTQDFLRLAPRFGLDPEAALHGGEDYVLLFALPPDQSPPSGCRWIGEATRSRQVILRSQDRREILQPRGWDHFSERNSQNEKTPPERGF